MRSQRVADHPLVAADVRLYQRPSIIAGRLLPGHATALGNELQMPVALRRFGSSRLARHRAGTRWYDDSCIGMAFDDGAGDVVSVVSPIANKRSHRTGHMIEQWPDL